LVIVAVIAYVSFHVMAAAISGTSRLLAAMLLTMQTAYAASR
jgi:hypothetical protein